MADLTGLLLVVSGAACYGRAFVGMRKLEHVKPVDGVLPPGSTLFAAMAEFSGYTRLAYAGLGLVAAGIVVAMASAMAWRGRRRADGVGEVPRTDAPATDAPLAA